MSGIIWLASYPKSGNTWLRAFLTNLLREDETPANINRLIGGPIASARAVFDAAVGYDAADLRPDEIERLRPEVYAYLARTQPAPLFLKVHDAYTCLPDGRPLFPPEATHSALYLIRNPLDVCVSYAHHSGHHDYEKVVQMMANPSAALAGGPDTQLRQRLLTWSAHVRSWVDAPGIRTHVVRYEDMQTHPIDTFTGLAAFAGLPRDPARLLRAVAACSFAELQRQEHEKGFRERAPKSTAFFHNGEAGAGSLLLTPQQQQRIMEDHGDVMRQFGYSEDQIHAHT